MRDRQTIINDTIFELYGAEPGDVKNQYLARIWKYEYKFVEETVKKWQQEILEAKAVIGTKQTQVKQALQKRQEDLQTLYDNLKYLEDTQTQKSENSPFFTRQLGVDEEQHKHKMKMLKKLARKYHVAYVQHPETLTAAKINDEIREIKSKQSEVEKFALTQRQAFNSIQKSFPTQDYEIF